MKMFKLSDDMLFVPHQTPSHTPPPRSPSPACCEEDEDDAYDDEGRTDGSVIMRATEG